MGLGVNEMSKLTVDAQIHDLEYQAQNINRQKLAISQQLEENAQEYEAKTSNRQMKIGLFLSATGTKAGYSDTQKTMNLTYKALVSGTVYNLDSGTAGIQGSTSAGTKNQDYTSNNFFRLVDPDGAIVVSSIDEIPNTFVEDISTDKTAGDSSSALAQYIQANHTKSGFELKYDSTNNVVMVSYTKTNSDGETDTVVKYFDGTSGTDREVKDASGNVTSSGEPTGGFVNARTKNIDDKNPIYKIEAVLDDNDNYVCKITTTTRTAKNAGAVDPITGEIVPLENIQGEDGTYEIVDMNSKEPITDFPKYRVDSMLKAGYSETTGSANGPNYLQDCLRNGKYLLQQGNLDNDEKYFKWKNLSWDSVTSISDNYYTEDDDAAKAKYDRIQTQLNAQEKKLDLQLDTIETQRSALTQQKESLDKCLDDNMESFKTFA